MSRKLRCSRQEWHTLQAFLVSRYYFTDTLHHCIVRNRRTLIWTLWIPHQAVTGNLWHSGCNIKKRGKKNIASLFHNLSTRWRWVVSSTLRYFAVRERSTSTHRRGWLGSTLGPDTGKEKNFLPLCSKSSNSLVIQPVA